MSPVKTYRSLTILFSLVWLVNGLICKVLNAVPRHQEIVARILGNEHARLLTICIGLGETLFAIWIFTRIKTKWNAIAQIMLVGIMNAIEFSLAPDLLLWGKFNALFAALYMALIYYHEFVLGKKLGRQS